MTRNFTRPLLLFLALLLCSVSGAQVTPETCAHRYALLLLHLDEPIHPEYTPLKLLLNGVPVDPATLPPGASETLDLHFAIPPDDQIDAVAKVFAVGATPEEIAQRFRTHQKNQPNAPISLKELGPKVMQEKTNTCAAVQGPNCWNTTLRWFFPDTPEKLTTAPELTATLQRKFRPLTSKERIKYGDVIVLRQSAFGYDDIIHSAVYLGNGYIWHKAGRDQKMPYVFSTLENMLRDYERALGSGGFYHEVHRLRGR